MQPKNSQSLYDIVVVFIIHKNKSESHSRGSISLSGWINGWKIKAKWNLLLVCFSFHLSLLHSIHPALVVTLITVVLANFPLFICFRKHIHGLPNVHSSTQNLNAFIFFPGIVSPPHFLNYIPKWQNCLLKNLFKCCPPNTYMPLKLVFLDDSWEMKEKLFGRKNFSLIDFQERFFFGCLQQMKAHEEKQMEKLFFCLYMVASYHIFPSSSGSSISSRPPLTQLALIFLLQITILSGKIKLNFLIHAATK